ncbi:FAD-dependent oxidoreductase [Nonomuraea sp. NPDC049695]|uniref:FAD-dependent oxidoreductase n=1 Tax=Nonomuraea sp. NPDC049695 TaxID=3154734 RepID=UPI00343C74D6
MSADPGIVIVGASLAGAKAAQSLRLDHGYDGPITLVGDEPHLPYQRPALSKGYLLGTTGPADLDVLKPPFYADQDIALALGTPATALDLDARRVRLADGTVFPFTQVRRRRRHPPPAPALPEPRTDRTLAQRRHPRHRRRHHPARQARHDRPRPLLLLHPVRLHPRIPRTPHHLGPHHHPG